MGTPTDTTGPLKLDVFPRPEMLYSYISMITAHTVGGKNLCYNQFNMFSQKPTPNYAGLPDADGEKVKE